VRPSRGVARLALAGLAAAAVAAPAGAVDVDRASPPAASRDLATVASRESTVGAQAAAARAAVRWRLRALRGLAAEAATLDDMTRARALDVGARVLVREVAEARSLAAERDRARAEGDALAAAGRAAEPIGAPPALVLPVSGPLVARFGVAPDRATGLLLPRAGVRLAAAPGAPVRAPFAGLVALVAREPEGAAVAIEDGAGWTTIVSGLGEASVAEGQRVAGGERLGVAGAPNGIPVVGFEVWRGRRPVDPTLFLPTSSLPTLSLPALAAPPPLP
jgi:murein DD-endopeptidase MepM/ murein hydrolase activator NlpD